MSFGFKRGDLAHHPRNLVVFDVRRISDPDQNLDLRMLTGLDRAVQDDVLRSPLAKMFLASGQACLDAGLNVAYGCAQGRHRSVALAQLLADRNGLQVVHRDWAARPHGEASSSG